MCPDRSASRRCARRCAHGVAHGVALDHSACSPCAAIGLVFECVFCVSYVAVRVERGRIEAGGCVQGWNGLQAADMHTLAEALRFNQSVHSIELQHNALGADGGAALGEVLYDNRCARRVSSVYACMACMQVRGRPEPEPSCGSFCAINP